MREHPHPVKLRGLVRPDGPTCTLDSMSGVRPLVLVTCLVAQGCTCGDREPGEAKKTRRAKPRMVPLVDKDAWVPAEATADPLPGHRPAEVQCPRSGWRVEPQGFEVNTQRCNYAHFSQPSLAPLVPGSRVAAMVYHFNLVAAEPATAHIAVAVAERVVWENVVAIPGKANVYNIEFTADFSAPAGTPVHFHLHNHGYNEWTLASMEVEADEPPVSGGPG